MWSTTSCTINAQASNEHRHIYALKGSRWHSSKEHLFKTLWFIYETPSQQYKGTIYGEVKYLVMHVSSMQVCKFANGLIHRSKVWITRKRVDLWVYVRVGHCRW